MLIDEYLDNVHSIAIGGHIHPDGDCCGSCLGMYNYISDNYPDISLDVFLEPIPDKFKFLTNSDKIRFPKTDDLEKTYDLFIALDCGDTERLGLSAEIFNKSKDTICIDHHISNKGFAKYNYIFPQSSSASELVYEVIKPELITKEIAECLYMGIAHDTGIFKYSCTSSKTMNIAGCLMDKGIDYPKIIDESYCIRSFKQNKAWGAALQKAELCLDGKCIYTIMTYKDMADYGVNSSQLDGIVSELRSTEGVEVSMFLYQLGGKSNFKLSLRSANYVDVAAIAGVFGGGGHVRAAGATISGQPSEIVEMVLAEISKQI